MLLLSTSDVVEARLDPPRHFLVNLLVFSAHILLLNFTDCFGSKVFALDSNNSLQTLSKPLLFLSHLVPYTRKRITLANAVSPISPVKKSLGAF